jgi:hypothetical protein
MAVNFSKRWYNKESVLRRTPQELLKGENYGR